MERNQCIIKACEAVANMRVELDRLSEKVIALEATVRSGTKIVDEEFVILTELLMEQLLKLDTIQVDGEAIKSADPLRYVIIFVLHIIEVCDYFCSQIYQILFFRYME
ncbi:BAG family molecular chaperone regulator 4 [Morella rubra]|uniref:BAG family molecular chaperone regulator 4 n=1 Tax=Morella rubra TaxID=262757 RepID=A0A6A1URM2_9ROSI|nr:BAG family molecular chaperone regulator 4 [Morella rubra]